MKRTHGCLVIVFLVVVGLTGCRAQDPIHVIQGTLLGQDGQPLEYARLSVRKTGFTDRVEAANDGSFRLEVPSPGAYFLTAIGLHHQSFFQPVYVDGDEPTVMNLRFAAVRLEPTFQQVGVIGEFNEFDDDDGVLPLEKQADGSWRGVFAAPADTFAYQLMGVQFDEFMLGGTSADYYVVDTNYPTFTSHAGKYISVLDAPNDSVEVVFDPANLPSEEGKMIIQFENTASRAARIAEINTAFEQANEAFSTEWELVKSQGGSFGDVTFDWSLPKQEMRSRLSAEEDSLLQRYIILSYLEKLRPDSSDTDMAHRLFEEVPPSTGLWSFVWGIPSNMVYRSAMMIDDHDLAENYALRVVEANPDSMVQAAFLAYVVSRRFAEMKDERAGLIDSEDKTGRATREFSILFDKLMMDYADTHYATRAKQQYAPERAIQPGNDILPLASRTLPDTSQTATLSELKGRVTLLEFWAIWCGPCIGEMPVLHEVYEAFADRGFEIVSVSVDENPRDVAAFREEKWAMPWKHLWLQEGWDDDIMKEFEVAGVPKNVLIDENGQIIATGSDVRGEKLVKTLESVFENLDSNP